MRMNEQYWWNIAFLLLFLVLMVAAAVVLEHAAYRSVTTVNVFDMVLIALAAFRLIRLFVYDAITKFFREQFLREVYRGGEATFEKPAGGPRRTIADLLLCPWCFGIWATAVVVFFYFLTPFAFFFILVLALSGAATLLQLLANAAGWQAQKLKGEAEHR